MSLTPGGFRRSGKTTEAWMSIVVAFGIIIGCDLNGDSRTLMYLFSILSASFVVGRTIYKKNRSIPESSITSGEFFAVVSSHLIATVLFSAGKVNWHDFAIVTSCLQMVYNICRGIAKGVGVKTQVLMR